MLKGVYQPRHAKVTALYQCISNHFQEFESLYPEKYQERYGFYRPVIQKVVEKFLDCGDLTRGFARVKCGQCQHEYLLAFSCKGRYFCPSCHQKRVLQSGEWVTEQVLHPIPHRQYVFTIPKILRIYFRKDRRLLAKLSQCAYACLKVFFQATLRKKHAVPRGDCGDSDLRGPGELSPPSACHCLGWTVCAQWLVLCERHTTRPKTQRSRGP